MLNEREKAGIDQGFAALVEFLPPLWWRLYLACMGEGFTESQALDLVKTYIVGHNPHRHVVLK